MEVVRTWQETGHGWDFWELGWNGVGGTGAGSRQGHDRGRRGRVSSGRCPPKNAAQLFVVIGDAEMPLGIKLEPEIILLPTAAESRWARMCGRRRDTRWGWSGEGRRNKGMDAQGGVTEEETVGWRGG